MSTEHVYLAPLIRGIWINISGESRVVVPAAAVPCKVPDGIVFADLSAAGTEDGLDEALAIKALKEAYSAWEAAKKGNIKTQPSCIRIKTPSNEEAVYWIDRDLASARKRSENGDGSPLELRSNGTSGAVPERMLCAPSIIL